MSVEKEFIPYEEALALKELGFDEPCFFAFDNCSTPMRCTDLRTNEQKFNGVNYNSSPYTSQPTFSQAFRWFREKYKMTSSVRSYFAEEFFCEIYVSFNHDITSGMYNSYEDAELECLRKLIETVKEKGI